MAIINSGFDGTVTELAFARIMRAVGLRDSVADAASWKVTQGTGRQVSVAPGIAYATGVTSDSDAAQLKSLPTPVNGQWHLIVRRINWATNVVEIIALPHTSTSTTVPTVPPTTAPTISDNSGVVLDQKLSWAWVNSVNTNVTLFDLRVYDIPWTPVVAVAPFTSSAEARRLSGRSEVRGVFQATASGTLGLTFVTIGVLPFETAPTANMLLSATYSGAAALQCQVTTDGRIQIRSYSTSAAYTTAPSISLAGQTW